MGSFEEGNSGLASVFQVVKVPSHRVDPPSERRREGGLGSPGLASGFQKVKVPSHRAGLLGFR